MLTLPAARYNTAPGDTDMLTLVENVRYVVWNDGEGTSLAALNVLRGRVKAILAQPGGLRLQMDVMYAGISANCSSSNIHKSIHDGQIICSLKPEVNCTIVQQDRMVQFAWPIYAQNPQGEPWWLVPDPNEDC